MIRTRFAPSPTGFLHVGGLRTALFSYLLAKNQGGQFLVRIEDTDQARFVEGAVENLLSSLKWAGIVPDEGVLVDDNNQVFQKGEYGPYIQSERLDIYHTYVNQLLENGHAYHCFCSKERLDELRKMQEMSKQGTGYDGFCRTLSLDDAKQRIQKGEVSVVRMKMPREGVTKFQDMIRGTVEFQNALVDDQVLLKSDGFPTYHLAVVVDDHCMKITHVIRGEEWLSSTPKHIVLYQLFGWDAPEFAHLPLLVNAQKQKLSKRHGDVSVEDFRSKGYLPEALVNFVAFLGWNPGDDREMFTIQELEKEFSLARASKSSAVFNEEKLIWYNKAYLKTFSGNDLAQRALPFFEKAELVSSDLSMEQLGKLVSLEKERANTLQDIPPALSFFFVHDLEYDPAMLVWKKDTAQGSGTKLDALKEILESLSEKEWSKEILEPKILEWIKQKEWGVGDVLWPMRVALSGQKNSPGPFEIADVLGKQRTLERIEKAIEMLKQIS